MYKIKIKPVHNILIACGLIFYGAILPAQEVDEEVALTGRELLTDCEQSQSDGTPNKACMQYVFGLVQTVVMLQQADPGTKLFCIDPTATSLEEVTTHVTLWLKAVPQRLEEEAYVLVSEALNTGYPCPLSDVI
ncbi:MAG: hypothetical protein ACI9SC_002906 [Gammaproteobacteria bacterium]|jgi:hypothetical protein